MFVVWFCQRLGSHILSVSPSQQEENFKKCILCNRNIFPFLRSRVDHHTEKQEYKTSSFVSIDSTRIAFHLETMYTQ
jgi:hypothetical protein